MSNESLLKLMLQKYRFHLLPIPREAADIGLVYLYNDNSASEFATLNQLFEPSFDIPQPKIEDMAFFNGKVSSKVEIGFGVKLLRGFLNLLGAGQVVDKIGASYDASSAKGIKFSFSPVKRHSILPYTFKDLLRGRTIKEKDLVNQKQGEYFVVTGILVSPSITIEAVDQSEKSAKFEVAAPEIAEAKGKVEIENVGAGLVKYNGTKDLAFGVQIHRLIYDRENNTFNFPEVTQEVALREDTGSEVPKEVTTYIEPPALLGDPSKGDIFLPLK